MTSREKIILWLTSQLMKRYFSGYVFPFGTSSAWLAKQSTEKKLSYALQARDFLTNEFYERETEEMIRKFMHHLSMESNSSEERAAYRLTLTFIRDFQQHAIRVASTSQSVRQSEVKGKM